MSLRRVVLQVLVTGLAMAALSVMAADAPQVSSAAAPATVVATGAARVSGVREPLSIVVQPGSQQVREQLLSTDPAVGSTNDRALALDIRATPATRDLRD